MGTDAATHGILRDLFERVGYAVRGAANGDEALRLVEEKTPDAVVLEVATPGVTGYALCRLLRARFGERLPIIFLSGERVEPLDRTAGLLIGADDYIVKPFDTDELVARFQRLVARSKSAELAQPGQADMDRRRTFALTPRENEILGLLVGGLNQAQIAHRLVISPYTVATHIQRILVKLGVHNRAQAVALAARQGLVSLHPESLTAALELSRQRIGDSARRTTTEAPEQQ